MKYITVLLLCVFILFTSVKAYEESGINLPAKMKLGDKELVYNGAGTVTKFFFKVYVIALYVEKKTQDANYLLNKDVPYIIYMHFKRNGISDEKVINAWNEGFKKATNDNTDKIKTQIAQFNAYFKGRETNENDTYRFEYIPGTGTKVYINNKYKGTVPGFYFKRALLGIWLGDDPRDEGAKEEMLGIDDD
jgi:predicted transcriptional regulator YdeE